MPNNGGSRSRSVRAVFAQLQSVRVRAFGLFGPVLESFGLPKFVMIFI